LTYALKVLNDANAPLATDKIRMSPLGVWFNYESQAIIFDSVAHLNIDKVWTVDFWVFVDKQRGHAYDPQLLSIE